MMRGADRIAAVAVLSSVASAPAWAGGIFVPGAGPQAQARAGAFVAKADDPSALMHNPAGLAKGVGTVIQIGATFLRYTLEFQRSGSFETPVVDDGNGNAYPVVEDNSNPAVGFGGFQAVPIIGVTTDLGLGLRGIRFGAGLFAPNGFPQREMCTRLGGSCVEDYAFEDPTRNPPPGRYDVQEQDVAVAFPSLGVGYSVPESALGGFGQLDLGMRLSWGFGGIKATNYVWALRNYEEDIAGDGLVDIDVSDHFIPAFGLGALYRPTANVELGAAYSSKASIGAKGTAFAVLGSGLPALGGVQEELIPSDFPLCEGGGEIGALKTCLDIVLPQTASVGGRYVFRDGSGRERADIELDLKWEDWSAGSDYRVRVDGQSQTTGLRLNEVVIGHGLKDVLSVRLGGSVSIPLGFGTVIVRAGAAHDTEAAPERWNRLDLDSAPRTTLASGLAFEAPSFRVEAGLGAVLEPDRSVAACNPDVGDPTCPGFSENRPSPSPSQPLEGARNQTVSPFNGGDYSSGYLVFSAGVTAWF